MDSWSLLRCSRSLEIAQVGGELLQAALELPTGLGGAGQAGAQRADLGGTRGGFLLGGPQCGLLGGRLPVCRLALCRRRRGHRHRDRIRRTRRLGVQHRQFGGFLQIRHGGGRGMHAGIHKV
jgi:hypothetical protein